MARGLSPAWLAASALPDGRLFRLRVRLLQLAGCAVDRSATLMDVPRVTAPDKAASRLRIGAGAFINIECVFDLAAPVTVGDKAYLAHRVMILTASHEVGPAGRRAGPRTAAPIVIESGAWIGAGVTLLPGVTIGAGSIVAAGSVVIDDVKPDTMVAGVPARPVRELVGAGSGSTP